MIIKNVYDLDNDLLITYYKTTNDILSYIKENNVTQIVLMENDTVKNVNTRIISMYNEKAKTENAKYIYFDETHKCFTDIYNILYTTKEFYFNNKEKIIKLIEDNLLKQEYPYVKKELYTDELAKKLALTAKQIIFEEETIIPDDVINYFKENKINVYIGLHKKKQISSSKILGYEYEDVISKTDEILLDANITDLENLKYIPKNCKILITKCDDSNYGNILKIIETLKKNNQTNEIVVNIRDRQGFIKTDLYKTNDYDYKISIKGYDTYTHAEIKNEEMLFDIISNDINSKNYSIYEKYLACYNITKKFKRYKENISDIRQSRDIKFILNNDYIVCIGFAEMLIELLRRVGLKACIYEVKVDTSYEEGFNASEKPVKFEGHARVIVYIDDSKYGIKGFYIADPTLDNDLENDYYNHALMTFDKTTQEKSFMNLSEEDLLMNVKSMDEFNERVNFYINRKIQNVFNYRESYIEKLLGAYIFVSLKIFSILNNLLPNEYKMLSAKYPEIRRTTLVSNKENYKASLNRIGEFLTDAGHIFINNLGKDVPIDVTTTAALNVNKEIFDFKAEEIVEYYIKLLEDNMIRDKECFPYYYQKDNGIVK